MFKNMVYVNFLRDPCWLVARRSSTTSLEEIPGNLEGHNQFLDAPLCLNYVRQRTEKAFGKGDYPLSKHLENRCTRHSTWPFEWVNDIRKKNNVNEANKLLYNFLWRKWVRQ